jgi:hypothetical protein
MITKLINTLTELLTFLQHHDVRYSVVVENYLKKLESASSKEEAMQIMTEVRERVLGGMGSLNDVWISKENGHTVDNENYANSQLEVFRDELRRILLS